MTLNADMKRKVLFILVLIIIFLLRLAFGLVSNIWSLDEYRIYMMGLNFYSTGHWMHFGPDVVYNNSRIPGGLQPFLAGFPFFILPVPEAPFIFLNLFTFLALCLLAWYIEKRIPELPRWMIWIWVLTAPWSVYFGARMINPSYLLIFSIVFFVGFFEMMPVYQRKIISRRWAAFMMGIGFTCSMQLHLSFVLLIPFIIAVVVAGIRMHSIRVSHIAFFLSGAATGLITLLPTLMTYGLPAYRGISGNSAFVAGNAINIFTILVRFVSFSTFEVPYFTGKPSDRLLEIRENPWMAPFTVILLVCFILQVAFLIICFFLRRKEREWKFVKWISFFTVVLVYINFFFSVKGPSSHTFFIVYPVSMIYSFYGYLRLAGKKWYLKAFFIILLVSGAVFLAGIGRFNYMHESLYLDRAMIQKSIDTKDPSIMNRDNVKNWLNKD
jgi:hypothetical protein